MQDEHAEMVLHLNVYYQNLPPVRLRNMYASYLTKLPQFDPSIMQKNLQIRHSLQTAARLH